MNSSNQSTTQANNNNHNTTFSICCTFSIFLLISFTNHNSVKVVSSVLTERVTTIRKFNSWFNDIKRTHKKLFPKYTGNLQNS